MVPRVDESFKMTTIQDDDIFNELINSNSISENKTSNYKQPIERGSRNTF